MTIVHDPDHSRFIARIDDQDVATLSYVTRGNTLDFQSVFVRPDHRGKGVAETITTAAFEHAQSAGRRVVPTCPYIRDTFLRRHAQYQALVT